MTAMNSVILADRAILISDTAACVDGAIVHQMHKVTPVPHANLAIGFRGARIVSMMTIDALAAAASSYDDLRARAATILRSEFTPIRPVWENQFGPDILNCEITVAGWSERNGPSAFVMATGNLNAAYGLPACGPIDISGTFFSPSDAQLSADFARIQIDFDDATALDLVRRQSLLRADVGGFVQLTTVYRDRIETRIIGEIKRCFVPPRECRSK